MSEAPSNQELEVKLNYEAKRSEVLQGEIREAFLDLENVLEQVENYQKTSFDQISFELESNFGVISASAC